MEKLNKKEMAAMAKLIDTPVLDQNARYRDSAGRTLTEIQQSKVSYRLNPKREGIMVYDNVVAEKQAKCEDPRYTEWEKDIKDLLSK